MESTRLLVVPVSRAQAWASIVEPARLPAVAPELEEAWLTRGGQVRMAARVGRRRRSWEARVVRADPERTLVLESATPGVEFRFEATLDPHPEGCAIRSTFLLVPPRRWLASPRVVGRAVVLQRLVLSTVSFAVAVAGLLGLRSAELSGSVAALVWAIVGAAFLGAVALLSGTHRRQHSDGEPLQPPEAYRLRA